MVKRTRTPRPLEEHIPDTRMADLLRAHGLQPSPGPPAPPAAPREIDLSRVDKLVLRRERKGRGGKTVTLLSGLTGGPAELEPLARALRKSLGCGATVEHGVIVVQGDIAPRVQAWLQSHGAPRVIIG